MPIPVIDIFAGPGGLGEGFSSIYDEKGKRGFKIALSVEKDEFAHRTLELRNFSGSLSPSKYHLNITNIYAEKITRKELFNKFSKESKAAKKIKNCGLNFTNETVDFKT